MSKQHFINFGGSTDLLGDENNFYAFHILKEFSNCNNSQHIHIKNFLGVRSSNYIKEGSSVKILF